MKEGVEWAYRLEPQDNNTIATVSRNFRDWGFWEKLGNKIFEKKTASDVNCRLLNSMINDLTHRCELKKNESLDDKLALHKDLFKNESNIYKKARKYFNRLMSAFSVNQ